MELGHPVPRTDCTPVAGGLPSHAAQDAHGRAAGRGRDGGDVGAELCSSGGSTLKDRDHEDLARERAILQYVVDHVPAWIFWKDAQGVYLGCNTSFAALDGKTDPRDLVGRTDDDMAWKAIAHDYRAGDREVLERGVPLLNKEEISPDGKGGEMVILTSKVPMRNEDGDVIGILGILVDITSRKRMELDLQRAKEAAEQAARARREFIANVSHELRTPLTLVLGPVRDVLDDPGLPDHARAALQRVERNAVRLYGLVDDVLDFAKADAGRTPVRREDLDLVAGLRALVDDLQPLAAGRRISLGFACEVATLQIALDPRLLERIVLNLVGNALKFTPPGGAVRVGLSARDGGICFEVSDTGIGIPERDLARLFRPFEQIDGSATRRHEGTGLGLVLVKHFAEAMGGAVSVTSEVGRGSTFAVTLPDGAAADGPRRGESVVPLFEPLTIAAPPEPPSIAGQGPRVLVVEDNPDMRAYVVETLARENAVVGVADGRAAWSELQAHPFEAVVADVMMPELDGMALTARIKPHATLRETPVILVTARGGAEAVRSGLDAGADDYLAKPFAAEELLARVRAAVRMRGLHEELRRRAHQAGMGDVAASVLHNLGNVLNSLNVSALLVAEVVRDSRATALLQALALLAEQPDPRRFLADDPRGARLLEYLRTVGPSLGQERDRLSEEIASLRRKLDHVKAIVEVQRSLARQSGGVVERVGISDLVTDAVDLYGAGYHDPLDLVPEHDDPGLVLDIDRHRVLLILVNLLSNASRALRGVAGARVGVRSRHLDGDRVEVSVTDNGAGIAGGDLERIFAFGFTTRAGGRGFGLHSSACAAMDLGGTLTAHSEGPGTGATFRLVVPRVRAVEP